MLDDFISQSKDILRRRLAGQSLPRECRADMRSQLDELSSMLRRTIGYGESNSALVIGMKGSGKSTLVKKSLLDAASTVKQFLTVHLNGFLQTDDRIALEEITRQLRLENTVGDRVFGSFSENLAFLLEALRTGESSRSSPIVFILEEFDLFAQHRNQTLLYNLFDIAQSSSTPIAVIGITCRIDVLELLEKRVKSRFSHRQIFVCNKWTFDEYVAGFSNVLKLSSVDDPISKKFAGSIRAWNASVDDLSKTATVLDILKRQFYINKEITGLLRLLTLPVAKISKEHPFITPADVADSASVLFGDSTLNLLRGVSVLELCLLIAMNHLTNVYSGEPFNYQMVYNEFLKFSQKKSHILQNYSKIVVLKAFEHLVEMEFVQPKDANSTFAAKHTKEFRPMLLLITEGQLKEAIDKYPGCPTDVKQWADSSIV